MGKKARASRARRYLIYDQLRAAMKARGLSRGPWFGSAADDALPLIADCVQEVLEEQLQQYEPRDLLRWVASNLAASQDAQYRARMATVGQPGNAAVTNLYTEMANSFGVLLELSLRVRPREGQTRIDQRARPLVELARQLWMWRLTADRAWIGPHRRRNSDACRHFRHQDG